MIRWVTQHVRTFGAAIVRLASAPVATIFNVLVIAIALALPAAAYVAITNLQHAARAAAPEPQLTIFLALDAARSDVHAIDNRLKGHPLVARFRFVPREQALQEMKRVTGMTGITEGLDRNPLPDAFVVNAWEPTAEVLSQLQADMRGWPKVAHVQLDAEWAQRLDGVIKFARLAVLLLATVLAFALVAITFNTIRLQILTHREEVEVAKLIGATDGFIRRPFLYYGALLGAIGGLAACGLIWAGTTLLEGAISELARAYGTEWHLKNLALRDSLSILAFAAALGWLGAWISVGRHLANARPN